MSDWKGNTDNPAEGAAFDLLRCNRCGKCREVCPITGTENLEWTSARGKIEIAEAFFRGEDLSEKTVRKVFDVCLHCKRCEESCPSGARGDRVVLEVLAEMGRRGVIPLFKKAALRLLDGADDLVFRVMRMLGIREKAAPHRGRGKSFIRFLYPVLGWPVQRLLPLPAREPFIQSSHNLFRSSGMDSAFASMNPPAGGEDFDTAAARELLEKMTSAREENQKNGRRACFLVGDAVNQFFGGEAEDVVLVLNLLGIDVEIPADQTCCSAPALYAGDAARAAGGAEKLVRILSGYRFDWLVTSCASGGLMLKTEYPGLLGLEDGYSGIIYDREDEVFRSRPSGGNLSEAGKLYVDHISGRVRDINELVADLLGFRDGSPDYRSLFSGEAQGGAEPPEGKSGDGRPAVVYHHPCHLGRGQKISAQPEYILKLLPGFRFREMEDADACCGGGGLFSFTEPEISARVGREKALAVAKASPDVVATSCPLCRIQISDMLQRDYGGQMPMARERMAGIPVLTPVQLLARDLKRMMGDEDKKLTANLAE